MLKNIKNAFENEFELEDDDLDKVIGGLMNKQVDDGGIPCQTNCHRNGISTCTHNSCPYAYK